MVGRLYLRQLTGASVGLAGACLLALAASILRHHDLVDLGLHATPVRARALVAGFALAGSALLALAGIRRWSPLFRWWLALPILAFCCIAMLASAYGVCTLEITYEKGDSNLRHLAVYQQSLSVWQQRAAIIRKGILASAGLDPLPAKPPLNPNFHSRKDRHGYTVENGTLETIPGFYLACNLYRPLPEDSNRKKPVILVPQGHFPNDRLNDDQQELAITLARMGTIAITYDMVGRGETRQVSHHDPRALTLQLWDSMRVLDFLLSLPDADPARVGMTGASGGGTQTMMLTAVDPRVTAAAPVVMVSAWMYGGCECESGLPIHHGKLYSTNNAEIAAMAAPRPQLIVSDGNDWTSTVPQSEFPFVRRAYQLYNAEDAVKNVHLPDEQHDYGPSKRQAVYRFFAAAFNLPLKDFVRPDGSVDESANTVEPVELLHAFDETHVLPQGALKGWDAVSNALHGLQQPGH